MIWANDKVSECVGVWIYGEEYLVEKDMTGKSERRIELMGGDIDSSDIANTELDQIGILSVIAA